MLVYDVTDERSFENIVKWLRNIDEVSRFITLAFSCLWYKALHKYSNQMSNPLHFVHVNPPHCNDVLHVPFLAAC